jgi:streptogramin lyase
MNCRHLINRSLLAIGAFVLAIAIGACTSSPVVPPTTAPSTLPVTEYDVSSSTTPPPGQTDQTPPPAGSGKNVTTIDPVVSTATVVDAPAAAASSDAAAAPATTGETTTPVTTGGGTGTTTAPVTGGSGTGTTAASTAPVMGPLFLATGSDGLLWFTDFDGSSVNSLDPSSLALDNYFLLTSDRNPTRITIGPDGNFWFDETGPMSPVSEARAVAEIATDGTLTEYPLLVDDSDPAGVTLGPDGNVWFTESTTDDVRNITAAGVISSLFPPSPAALTASGVPTGIVKGPDGNLWFAESGADKIGMLTPAGVLSEFPVTTGSGPADVVVGSDGELWFSEGTSGKIGRMVIEASGSKTVGELDGEFATPTTNSSPAGITVGPDCNIWFTETNSGYFGTITEAGAITEYTLPTADSMPVGIAVGPDGDLWIAESAANQLAQVTMLPAGSGSACSTVLFPSVAKCQDIQVDTDPNTCQTSSASINNGSFDPNSPAVPFTLSQTPAGPYSLGGTAATLAVTQTAAPLDVSACSASIIVVDKQPPTITCPAAQTVQCTSPAGAIATVTATATDNCPNLGAPSCSGSGADFPVGTTTSLCSVTDGSGNTATCKTSVTVQDTMPPVISAVTATPSVLVPNLKIDPVTLTVSVTDTCDPNIAQECKITKITTNDFSNTYKITGPLSANLLAAPALLWDRVYTLDVTCTDASGNKASSSTIVDVPNLIIRAILHFIGQIFT